MSVRKLFQFFLAGHPDRLRGAHSIHRPDEFEVVRKSVSRASERTLERHRLESLAEFKL